MKNSRKKILLFSLFAIFVISAFMGLAVLLSNNSHTDGTVSVQNQQAIKVADPKDSKASAQVTKAANPSVSSLSESAESTETESQSSDDEDESESETESVQSNKTDETEESTTTDKEPKITLAQVKRALANKSRHRKVHPHILVKKHKILSKKHGHRKTTDVETATDTESKTSVSAVPAPKPVPVPFAVPSDKMVGLKNLGQTCFANSIFQLLYHCDNFRVALTNYLHGLYIGYDQPERANVARALGKIFDAMDAADNFGKVLKPGTLAALPPELRSTKVQFDSFEVFSYYNLFLGFKWADLEIKEQNYNVINEEIQPDIAPPTNNPVLQLSFPEMNKATKISDMISHYFSQAAREPSDSEIFDGVISAARLVRIRNLPKTLIIHAKRFYQEFNKPARKINAKIDFEPEIDLAEYLDDNFEGDRNASKYELVGFIKHHGKNLKSGHYYTFFKRSDGTWVEINDSVVKERSEKRMQAEFADGYMFMYNRIEPVSIPAGVLDAATEEGTTAAVEEQQNNTAVVEENQTKV